MRRIFMLLIAFCVTLASLAGDRVPGEHWMRYTDVSQAGFNAAKLAKAKETWESIPSSAFMVVVDGAVVAAWGDVERRFMCHSVRKSFMSALYGIYWDQRKIDLNKTLADLGIDDHPDPLLPSEREARILDLLKARSGVFHPAAYAGRTDSAPRGSKGPGRYFAYNNWDFNTLAFILEQETGDKVFEAFDHYFGQPLQMEDWRVSDGYYHLEADKSRYPAYPFRMSARDAARFGLVFARDGMWGNQRILSHHWVRRSTALYSDDREVFGYGMLWWVARQPEFEKYGLVTALGVGNQAIAALPVIDMVIVNRANTYEGEGTPTALMMGLIKEILDARTGEPVAEPELVPLAPMPVDKRIAAATEPAAGIVGEWPFPATPLGMPAQGTLQLTVKDGALWLDHPFRGVFQLYPQKDGTYFVEDGETTLYPMMDENRTFAGLADAGEVAGGVLIALVKNNQQRANQLLNLVKDSGDIRVRIMMALADFFDGNRNEAESALAALNADRRSAYRLEGNINAAGYQLMQAGSLDRAAEVFALNTRLFPEAFNTWDSLAEVHMKLGDTEKAANDYRKSLELNPENQNAVDMLKQIAEQQ